MTIHVLLKNNHIVSIGTKEDIEKIKKTKVGCEHYEIEDMTKYNLLNNPITRNMPNNGIKKIT